MLDNIFYKKESPTFTGITRGVGGFGFGAASADDDDGGGGPSATNLAEFFGVDPTTSTTVRYEFLDQRYTGTPTDPASQWASYPFSSSTGLFVSRAGLTALDGRGIWKDSAPGFFATPSDIRWISSVSSHSGNWSYNPYSVDSSSTTDGAFAGGGGTDLATNGVSKWFDMVFSNGLVNNAGTPALGFVFSFYGNYTSGNNSYHHSILHRLTCNGVSASFIPKGELTPNNVNTSGSGNGGFVCYPTIYDPTTASQIDSTIGNITGINASLSHFVY